MPYRHTTLIPPKAPKRPGLWKRFTSWVSHKWNSLWFWFRYNKPTVFGGIAIAVFLSFFLACCYGIVAGDITIEAPDDCDCHHHHSRSYRRHHRR